jgi:hypothetical protein
MTEPASGCEDPLPRHTGGRYGQENPHFIWRDWLAGRLDEKLREASRHFVQLTAFLNSISTLEFPREAGSGLMFVNRLKQVCSACRAQGYS